MLVKCTAVCPKSTIKFERVCYLRCNILVDDLDPYSIYISVMQ